jgi:hypothetical protein
VGSSGTGGTRIAAFLSRLAAVVIAASASFSPSAAAQPRSVQASSTLPQTCPASPLVASTLKLPLQQHVITYTSITYGPTFPAGPNPVHARQRTCYYAVQPLQAANGNIVPVTITFEFPVSKTSFVAARSAASQSVRPITIPGLGDAAWYTNAPRADPRAGNSLFVLNGTDEIVLGGPPRATVPQLVALVRKIL